MKCAVITLGCKVNAYESEYIKENFRNNGYLIVNVDDKPDVVVINTCTVTNQSDAKSRHMIRLAKKKNNDAIIFLFNVTDESSYNRISNFYSQTKEYNKAVPTMMIGNFAEDSEHRVVHRAQVKKLAEDNGDLYFELLNSYDRNIYVYLEILTRRILETKGIVLRKPNNAYSIILTKTKEQKQKNNCI